MDKIEKKIKMRGVALKNLENVTRSGRPKGSLGKKTIVKEKAWADAEQEILEDILETVRAQKHIARGISVMMVPVYRKSKNNKGKMITERTGKFRQETNPQLIVERLKDPEKNTGKDYYFIHAEKPNPKALEDLMSRVFGRSRDKDGGGQDPFQLAFRNLFLTFTQNNQTNLIDKQNDSADPTNIYQPVPTELARPDDPGTTDIVERLKQAIKEPEVALEQPILD